MCKNQSQPEHFANTTHFCNVSICPVNISLKVSISNTFSRRLRVARLKLPLLAVDNVLDCNETELSCLPSDASLRPLKLLNTALACTHTYQKQYTQSMNYNNQLFHSMCTKHYIISAYTHIIWLQHFHPIALVLRRLAPQVPNTIVDGHIEAALVEFVALESIKQE